MSSLTLWGIFSFSVFKHLHQAGHLNGAFNLLMHAIPYANSVFPSLFAGNCQADFFLFNLNWIPNYTRLNSTRTGKEGRSNQKHPLFERLRKTPLPLLMLALGFEGGCSSCWTSAGISLGLCLCSFTSTSICLHENSLDVRCFVHMVRLGITDVYWCDTKQTVLFCNKQTDFEPTVCMCVCITVYVSDISHLTHRSRGMLSVLLSAFGLVCFQTAGIISH